jgi:hypothetical protein
MVAICPSFISFTVSTYAILKESYLHNKQDNQKPPQKKKLTALEIHEKSMKRVVFHHNSRKEELRV